MVPGEKIEDVIKMAMIHDRVKKALLEEIAKARVKLTPPDFQEMAKRIEEKIREEERMLN
jgi:hypothetical protein